MKATTFVGAPPKTPTGTDNLKDQGSAPVPGPVGDHVMASGEILGKHKNKRSGVLCGLCVQHIISGKRSLRGELKNAEDVVDSLANLDEVIASD
jgi:hypothetical protein